MEGKSDIITTTTDYVKRELANHDGSHDFNHIERVVKLALRIAEMEDNHNVDIEIVHLAALLHDIGDWKYSGTSEGTDYRAVDWLASQNYDPARIFVVRRIINNIGFKEELHKSPEEKARYDEMVRALPELSVVQDADRLDALGAIGIARAFTFGGTRKSPLYDENDKIGDPVLIEKEEYIEKGTKKTGSTVQHFHDKLLHLKWMMKTESGKKLAAARHAYMEEFLDQLQDERSGKC